MVELRLVGDGGDPPPSSARLVETLEEYLEYAHRGQIHSIAIVACGDEVVHTAAQGHDVLIMGAIQMLQHNIAEQSLGMM